MGGGGLESAPLGRGAGAPDDGRAARVVMVPAASEGRLPSAAQCATAAAATSRSGESKAGWYTVVGRNGSLVRAEAAMDSARVQEIGKGAVVRLESTTTLAGGKERARVTHPVEGWITFKGLKAREAPVREARARRKARWHARLATGEARYDNDADAAWAESLRCVLGHVNSVYGVAVSPDGRRVVTGSWDGYARLWDAESGELSLPPKRHEDAVLSCAWSPDGSRVATANYAQVAVLWDPQSGETVRTFRGHGGAVNGVAFSGGGARLVTASQDRTARVWDAETGAQLLTLAGHDDRPHRGDVWSCDASDDGRTVVTSSSDGTARLYDARKEAEAVRVFRGHGDRVPSCALSPDGGSLVATASWDGTARVWSAASGEEVAVCRGHAPPPGTNERTHGRLEGCAFLDATRVATTSWDRTARVWAAATGAPVAVLRGHSETVYCCAAGPDGALVATGAEDRTARVWDVARADAAS